MQHVALGQRAEHCMAALESVEALIGCLKVGRKKGDLRLASSALLGIQDCLAVQCSMLPWGSGLSMAWLPWNQWKPWSAAPGKLSPSHFLPWSWLASG